MSYRSWTHFYSWIEGNGLAYESFIILSLFDLSLEIVVSHEPEPDMEFQTWNVKKKFRKPGLKIEFLVLIKQKRILIKDDQLLKKRKYLVENKNAVKNGEYTKADK